MVVPLIQRSQATQGRGLLREIVRKEEVRKNYEDKQDRYQLTLDIERDQDCSCHGSILWGVWKKQLWGKKLAFYQRNMKGKGS